MRTQKIANAIEEVDKRTEEIMAEFSQFTTGARMLILLERRKEGGHNKEERRNLGTRFSFHEEGYRVAVRELLFMRYLYPGSRLYASVNYRNVPKVIREIERELLDIHYCNDETQVEFTHKKVIKSTRHFFMQQQCADESLFVIDVDDEEGKDVSGEALKECSRLGVEILKTYRTKNGWHFVTKPFNPGLWKLKSEIKKDALILLDF